jgi:hypothetical protein
VTTITSRVDQSTDDAIQTTGSAMYLTTGSLVVARPSYTFHCGLRFTSNISGLSGATINAGTYLTFRADYTDSGPFDGNWYAHDAAAPGTFTTTGSNISDTAQRPRTSASAVAGGVDFGPWSSGSDEYFPPSKTGSGLQGILQELATDYDPSAIVLLWIWTPGSSGERIFRSYDGSTSLAPLLTIDYTAATGATETSPTVVPIHVNIPAPTTGVRPAMVPIDVAIPAPTTGVYPSTVPIHVAIQTPQLVAGVKVYPEPVLIHVAIPSPTTGIRPTVVPIHVAIQTPTASQGTVQATPTVVPIHVAIITPVATGLGAAETFVPFGVWDAAAQEYVGLERYLDPSTAAPSGHLFFIEVGLATSDAGSAATAYLYCVDAAEKVPGSEATSTQTLYEVVQSGTFDLLSRYGAGRKKYLLYIGGATGGSFGLWGGDIRSTPP